MDLNCQYSVNTRRQSFEKHTNNYNKSDTCVIYTDGNNGTHFGSACRP